MSDADTVDADDAGAAYATPTWGPPTAGSRGGSRARRAPRRGLWARLGWGTRVVGAPGDRGIDVVATATTDEDGPQKQLIQPKRYGPTTTVGSPEVQQYSSLRLKADDVDQVTIGTTGTSPGRPRSWRRIST